MSEEKIKELNRKRGSIKTKLTQFSSYLNIVTTCVSLSEAQFSELEFRLDKIQDAYFEYDTLQTEIEMLAPDSDIEAKYTEREQFESQYYKIVASARALRDSQRPSKPTGDCRHSDQVGFVPTVCDNSASKSNLVRLPKIDLIPFSGDYQHWLEFKDTFLSLIHNCNSLDNISKFHYLRRSLKGSAELVISNLDFTSDNYTIAWSLLCERYDNKRLLVNNHVQALFNIEQIHKESCKALRNLIDITNKNLRALNTLGQPTTHWDTLIIYMMSTKLDYTTSREWEEFRNTLKEPPTLKDFLLFLSDRADLLETLEDSKQKKTESNKSKSFVIATQNPNKISCPMCSGPHFLFSCELFRKLNVESRNLKARESNVCLNCLRPGHAYKKCKLSHCKYCKIKHNTLLHMDKQTDDSVLKENVTLSSNTDPLHTVAEHPVVLLSTAMVKVSDHQGRLHTARLLLDSGSTASFATRNLCDKLGLVRRNTSSTVTGIGNQSSISTQSCNLSIESYNGGYKVNVDCYVLPEITKTLPTSYINIQHIPIPSGLQLADPSFNIPAVIDLLVGAEIFWSVLGSNSISLGKNLPQLRESKLGWIITGSICHYKQEPNICNFVHTEVPDLSRFWEYDTVSPIHAMSQEERACEESFALNTQRDEDGHFVVTIPLKESPEVLGDSYQMAKTRFFSLERRFARDPLCKERYCQFLNEYEKLGHMTEINTNNNNNSSVNVYYPHHGVIRESSTTTKLRVVFDASAATTSGKSFNDIQMVGPTVQDDLQSILLRFRQHKYVVTSDIEKMYRAISVTKSQRSLQQILFRYDSSEPLKSYTLNTVTFGMSSAPYLATKCLVSLADHAMDDRVKNSIKHDFYVDDYLSGGESIQSVIDTCQGVISTLESAKFNLRKWQSNNIDILTSIAEIKGSSDKSLNLNNDKVSCKTLGLNWSCNKDTLFYSINLTHNERVTKRHILSVISQIFDPLGLVGPCIVEAKILMQRLWVAKCEWDDDVPADIFSQWVNFAKLLPLLNSIQVPRWVLSDSPLFAETHTFTDASERAYGACVYVRTVSLHGSVDVHLLASKNKIAPIKPPTTIPRLELCGALLGTRLCTKVLDSLTIHFKHCYYWCDSTIVLGWLASAPSQLKPFIRNRVHEIQENTSSHTWSYVPSKDNPADLASRGVRADQIGESSLWWSGPSFLKKDPSFWPTMPNEASSQILPETSLLTNITSDEDPLIKLLHRKSNFSRLVNIFAYIRRFINNCKKQNTNLTGPLSVAELQSSKDDAIHFAQKEMFPLEYSLLKAGKPLPTKNRLLPLTPYLDPKNIIRVGGRLKNSFYPYDVKHPILLCSKHHLTKIIFSQQHEKLCHAGPQLLLSNIRQTYWPLGGRDLAKRTMRTCVKCFRMKAKPVQPIMGDLPHSRVHLEFPFLDTGIDYAGPVLILNRKGRGSKLIKAYICVFVCLAVKAVHIELVTDLTKEAFLAALNRFVSRRGKPKNIFSDNGTTFIGASNELARFVTDAMTDITSSLNQEGINFSQIPPYTPHFGGLWEAAVKSVKHHLRRILSLAHLDYQEMMTCLIGIEAILNSRPLTPFSTDPTDYTALTPSHFLIGRSLMTVPYPQVTEININRLQRYQRVEHLKQHFWERFHNEYISLLQQKVKWCKSVGPTQLQQGSLVIVKDKGLPPLLWLLGRVQRVHPGSDGVVRVADIATKKGVIQRAAINICPLPMTS